MALQDTAFNRAMSTYGQAASSAMPSPQSRDTAAARVRARVAGQGQAMNNQLRQQSQQSGQMNTGRYDANMARAMAANQGALASGLADVEDNYQRQRMEGAGILSNIAQGYGGLGESIGGLKLGGQRLALEDRLGTGRLRLDDRLGSGRLKLDTELGRGELGLGRDRLNLDRELGSGQLDLGRQSLEETSTQNRRNSLSDLFNSFGTFGNTPFMLGLDGQPLAEGTPEYERALQQQGLFDSIISQMFGAL